MEAAGGFTDETVHRDARSGSCHMLSRFVTPCFFPWGCLRCLTLATVVASGLTPSLHDCNSGRGSAKSKS